MGTDSAYMECVRLFVLSVSCLNQDFQDKGFLEAFFIALISTRQTDLGRALYLRRHRNRD